jgi:hypothetical protein
MLPRPAGLLQEGRSTLHPFLKLAILTNQELASRKIAKISQNALPVVNLGYEPLLISPQTG